MDKYEISLWEEFPDLTSDRIPFLNERKLCVIGSDTMRDAAKAVEPKMINNINGTNTFTFKMYSTYTDEFTGEKYKNPFLNLLINERKVKVLWKDKWYDLLIKNLDENTQDKSITYTCKDSYITELSRNGYNLEYSLDLQNNTGTASELVESVLQNSGWTFDKENSTKIIQKTEEPVYETKTKTNFTAIKQSPNGDEKVEINAGESILVFYSSVVDITTTQLQDVEIQFLYSADGYATDENDMLVLNGDCYSVKCKANKIGGHIFYRIENNLIIEIDTTSDISSKYRAERLVKTQKTKYDELLDKYVKVYENNIYGYETTKYSDPIAIVNLLVNPSNFTGLEGWIGEDLNWGLYPKFTRESNITEYNAKSYLKVNSGYTYNSAFSSNISYLTPTQIEIKNGDTGGFHKGEQYIFRVKFKSDLNNEPNNYIDGDNILPIITINENNQPSGENYFDIGAREFNQEENWNEYTLTCNTSCTVSDLQNIGFFINVVEPCWIEDIQFFKFEMGVTTYDEGAQLKRINPGEISLQSVVKKVYRYYNADHNGVEKPEDLKFLYESEEESTEYVPVTNNYEKLATIEAKNSNRFNILQSIAENFKCWVRFVIDHDELGRVTFDENGLPNKKVVLVEEIGKDLGWSFEYGIDTKNILRKIVSDNLTTKVLVLPNDNEFGKNGFCTIARSNLNYTKENFVLDFGYYINQGLLDQNMINRDLYSSANNYIGYYYHLHSLNKEYDEITDILLQKRIELNKQQSQLTVLEAQQQASNEELGKCKADVMTLACVNNWDEANNYVQSHADYIKVQSLMNTIARLQNTIDKNNRQLIDLCASVEKLEEYINTRAERQKEIAEITRELDTRFFKKYARYIQEGTWQDSSYIDDDKYYLDAIDVAYTSARPQLQYDINVMRLTSLEDFSSKSFEVGDICYVVDRDFFGYAIDGITPYKLKITISEITSYFDTPEKDIIKVQNYKTQFDDLFQRITATTQSLQYAAGSYQRAASVINPDKTLSFDLLQDTFDYNEDLVINASNQQITWDSTGITITDDKNTANKLRLMAGGLFISNDGGDSWKNAVRGDGISADVLTAGRVNTNEIFIYDGGHPSFRWDSSGINAYHVNNNGTIPILDTFVRFDQFGLYGYQGTEDFQPSTEDAIWENEYIKFGLTWKGFFLHGGKGNSQLEIADDGDGIIFSMKNATGKNSLEISTSEDIVLKTGDIKRVQIGRLDPMDENTEYGIWVRDNNGDSIFNVSSNGTNSIGGWTLTKDSFYHTDVSNNTIGLYSNGKNTTIQGNTADYYILAGKTFGVTIDGKVYASAGKIGGWNITNSFLYNNNIQIDSTGSIRCTVLPFSETNLPLSSPGIIYIVAENKIKKMGTADPNFTYSIVINQEDAQEYGITEEQIRTNLTVTIERASGGNIGNYTITPSGSSTITINNQNFVIKYIPGNLTITNYSWNIDSDGYAYFHNISADGGYIAGWHIDNDKIWNDNGTTLSASGNASYSTNRYTIVTNSIAASGGTIGGWSIGSGLISNGISLIPSGMPNGPSVKIGSTFIQGDPSGGGIRFSGTGTNWSKIYVGDVIFPGLLSVNDTLFKTDQWQTGATNGNRIQYLDWLHSNWGSQTPNEVRAEGKPKSAAFERYSEDGSKNFSRLNITSNNGTVTIPFGDLQIGTINIYENKTYWASQYGVDCWNIINVNVPTGTVMLDFQYNEKDKWTGYIRARCTLCGYTSWQGPYQYQ